MVKDIGSATVVAPMIKDYLDVGIKNDDQLVKLSAVLQRFISGSSSTDDQGNSILSDSEKQELLDNVKTELNSLEKTNSELQKRITETNETPPSTED